MPTEVQHLSEQQRYIFSVDGRDVGLTDYRMLGGDIHIVHTEIDPRLRGRGHGAAMVREVLDQIRAEGTGRVVADCPFVVDFMVQHPEYQELERRG